MALGEVSANVQRKPSTAQSCYSIRRDAVNPRSASSLAPSSVVQSMLKNTTELGDTGQFSVRPSRLPRSASRLQCTRTRSGSFDTSFPSALQHRQIPYLRSSRRNHGPRHTPSLPTLTRPDNVISNLTSSQQNHRSRARDHRQYLQGFEGPARAPLGVHGLYSHRSLITLRGQRDFRGTYSNSSIGYPAKFHGPGPRNASPAISEAHAQLYNTRNHHASSVGTIASSPASLFPSGFGMLGYRPNMNNSFPSLIRLPSPGAPSIYNTGQAQRISRSTTPLSFQGSRVMSNGSVPSFRGLPRSPTGSTAPRYYDYSESFVEEDCFSPDTDISSTSLPFNMDQTILENRPVSVYRHAQTPFGTMPGSKFYPSELPTVHNRRPREHSRCSVAGHIPDRTTSLAATSKGKQGAAGDDKYPTETDDIEHPGTSENDAPRASAASRRSCTSSPSNIFFPNATRSPRDLTSLAAKVHSPVLDENIHSSTMHGTNVKTRPQQRDRHEPRMMKPLKVPTWQIPSLEFRPLSFVAIAQDLTGRPKTSPGMIAKRYPKLISPIPEKPMSSQSRRLFNKILGIGDDYRNDNGYQPSFNRSHDSLNFAKLKDAEDASEASYSQRFLIPPFSPRGRVESERETNKTGDGMGDPDVNSSQGSSNEHSTIESLLDKHIECLGLQLEIDDSENASGVDIDGSKVAESTDSTIKLPTLKDIGRSNSLPQPQRIVSTTLSSLTSGERCRLMPRRLFSSMDALNPGLAFTQSVPCITEERTKSGSRLSYGWQTLASTNQFDSTISMTHQSLGSGELADVSGDLNDAAGNWKTKKYKIRHRAKLILSSSSSVQSQEEEGPVHVDETVLTHRRLKVELFNKQILHRRSFRVRLKMKRNSVSSGKLMTVDPPSPVEDNESWRNPPHQPPDTALINPLSPVGTIAELSAEATAPMRTMHDLVTVAPMRTFATSPRVPNRWSSILAIAPDRMKEGIELVRQISTQSIQSLRSDTSLAEPVNSSRPSAQISRQTNNILSLAPLDLDQPLALSSIDVSLPYADIPSTVRPTLRGTRSFFSDDSSALRNKHSSFRKKLHIRSLRGMLPASPTVVLALPVGGDNARDAQTINLSHSCQIRGRESASDQNSNLDGIVGMSEFTYKKSKVFERLKRWWGRQCIQRRLAIKKKKNEKQRHGRQTGGPTV